MPPREDTIRHTQRFSTRFLLLLTAVALLMPASARAQDAHPDARALGIPLNGTPGKWNAITDVAGVEVGHTTIIRGNGALVVGQGPVRTGVTAILPRGRTSGDSAFAGWFSLNGNGEMTGTTWIEEGGILETPILITNTHSVGVARDALIDWMRRRNPDFLWALPVVAETYDGTLERHQRLPRQADRCLRRARQRRLRPVSCRAPSGAGPE